MAKASVPVMQPWPVDSVDGAPLALVTMGAQELIPTVQYGNVTVGPASVTKFVPDDPEAIEEGLRDCVKACEQIISEERETLLTLIRGSKVATNSKG